MCMLINNKYIYMASMCRFLFPSKSNITKVVGFVKFVSEELKNVLLFIVFICSWTTYQNH